MSRNINDLLLQYFQSYNRKDIKSLETLLSKEVALIDWENDINGRELVLELASKTFSSFPFLEVEIKNVFFADNIAFSEICVHLNEKTSLDVVDVFDIKNDKIVQIRAYRK